MADQTNETRDYEIDGIRLAISDSAGSQATDWIANEMALDEYRLRRIPFGPGDVVIDVGAHVGFFSLYLAVRHPAITTVALEPEPGNFARLAVNIARNWAFNVIAFNLAVTADGAPFPISCPPANSGGAGGYTSKRWAIGRRPCLRRGWMNCSTASCPTAAGC